MLPLKAHIRNGRTSTDRALAAIRTPSGRRAAGCASTQARELAPAQSTAQKHRENRAVPLSFGGLDLGLSKQVASLFPGEPVPCPVAGLADALEGHDSLGQAAIEQPVFGRFCGQLADRRQPQIDGSRRQTSRFQNAPVLLDDCSAKWRSGFGRVPGQEIFKAFS
jgi:hypothetical protein